MLTFKYKQRVSREIINESQLERQLYFLCAVRLKVCT